MDGETAMTVELLVVRPEGAPAAWFSTLVVLRVDEGRYHHIPKLHPVSGAATVTLCDHDLCDPEAIEKLCLWIGADHVAVCPTCLKESV